MKDKYLQIQVQLTLGRINSETHTKTHYKQTVLRQKQRENPERYNREVLCHNRESSVRLIDHFSSENMQAKRVGRYVYIDIYLYISISIYKVL